MQSKVFSERMRKMSPAIVTERCYKREKTQGNGGSGIFYDTISGEGG